MLDLLNQSKLQDAYFIQEKARKIRKMLLCKMRYNRPFNLIDKQNMERYSITFEDHASL